MGHYNDAYEFEALTQEKRIQERKATMSKQELKETSLRLIERILERKAIGNDERIAAEWLVEELSKIL